MSDKPKVIIDQHEPDQMMSLLMDLGVAVKRKHVSPGDYILSGGCAIERKTISDFFSSLYNGRLFEQIERLRTTYEKPMLFVEGDLGAELEDRKNPRSFWGALLRIQMDLGVPALTTADISQSANAIYTLSLRLNKTKEKKIFILHKPKSTSKRDQQISMIASVPGVGPELALRLLKSMTTVRKVFLSSKDELMKVPGIGDEKAGRITSLLDLRVEEEA